MPGSRDWKDYIPASGEASVNLGLKGRYGKGSSRMRYRRARKGPSRSRFWAADNVSLVPTDPIQLSYVSSQLIMGINPNLALPTPTTLNTPYDQKYKVIGRQGFITGWRQPNAESVWQLEESVGAGGQPMLLSYIWRVEQITADALSAEATGSAEPDPAGDLPQMLQSDRVLNWGSIFLPNFDPRFIGSTGFTSAGFVPTLDPANYFIRPGYFRIPLWRQPRLGITLGRDKAIVLRTRVRQFSQVSEAWVDPVNDSLTFVHPMVRVRYTR